MPDGKPSLIPPMGHTHERLLHAFALIVRRALSGTPQAALEAEALELSANALGLTVERVRPTLLGGRPGIPGEAPLLEAIRVVLQTNQQRNAYPTQHSDMLFVWDLRTGSTHWNHAIRGALRYAPEAVGPSLSWWRERIDPKEVERVWEGLRRALASERENWSEECRFLRGDGTWGVLLWRGLIARDEKCDAIRMVGSIVDLTEKRNAEETRAKLVAIVESSDDAIIGIDVAGVIATWNAAATRIFGYGADEAIGRPFSMLCAPDSETDVGCRDDRIGSGERVTNLQTVRRTKDGRSIDVAITISPLTDADGRVVGASAIVRDTTEQRRLERQLALSDRMASMGTVAAGVAHEINNPLAYVLANLDMLSKELTAQGQSSLHDLVCDAKEGAQRIRLIVRDLRTFTRSEDRTTHIDVRRVLDSSINLAATEIRHRARLIKEYGDTEMVIANESRLGQVFLNLLVNAAQAIPEGAADKHEIRVITHSDASGRVVTEIRDSGSGIAADALPRIFEPFFTTKPIGVGTGLGLSICLSIVKAAGGEIEVESDLGCGSTFRVLLPAARSHVPTPVPSTTSTSSTPTARQRVLVIDDDAAIRVMLARTLTPQHDVVCVPSAREALQHIASRKGFDVILCDLMMPEMSGMTFHQELSRCAPDEVCKVIFMTGGAFTPGASQFLQNVPNPILEKPFDLGHLLDLVAKMAASSDASHSR